MSGEQNRRAWCSFAMDEVAMEQKKNCWRSHNNATVKSL